MQKDKEELDSDDKRYESIARGLIRGLTLRYSDRGSEERSYATKLALLGNSGITTAWRVSKSSLKDATRAYSRYLSCEC